MSSPSADLNRLRSPEIPAPRPQASHLRLKRCIDLIVGVGALFLLAPVIALIALIVRLDSSGPILFRQTRIGMGGRPFEMFKFRSMMSDAPDDLHRDLVLRLVQTCAGDANGHGRPIAKLVDDPRITRAGRWLRRTSLDELPQLLNVLRGHMSLVGPRPPVTYEYEAYEPWQLERFAMPQGMTGLWQVSGRNKLTYRQMHELDVEYVRNWSLWLDLKILAKTPRAVALDGEPAA